jgi:hypothetical protein
MRRRSSGTTILYVVIGLIALFTMIAGNGCTMAILHSVLGSAQTSQTDGEDTGDDPPDNPPEPPDSGGLTRYLCDTSEVTVAWDPPPGEIAGYRVYYRTHGDGSWTLVAEVPVNDNPELELQHGDFGDGDFDFGVIAVGVENEESAMHTSLDPTALPTTGWYLSWSL